MLKGHRTLVAAPEGTVAINMTGNPGMATGGTGDVLTGVIAGWFGQLLDAEGAARLGVYLHGHAGDLAMADLGEVALTASDLLTYLGDAVLELSAERTYEQQTTRTSERDEDGVGGGDAEGRDAPWPIASRQAA